MVVRYGTGGVDVPGAVQAWYDEKSFYNYQTKACDAGEMCGHYTQVGEAKYRYM